ncbi:endochitinase A-like [Homalodisca vitripennis]|uniref:endochitinase A-like n=1 Tax=Homalodisca vitripennis TaxID=197043 RepID=UPI001EEB901C|nr:endochitinase A-like [Homalodisca vitripennis]
MLSSPTPGTSPVPAASPAPAAASAPDASSAPAASSTPATSSTPAASSTPPSSSTLLASSAGHVGSHAPGGSTWTRGRKHEIEVADCGSSKKIPRCPRPLGRIRYSPPAIHQSDFRGRYFTDRTFIMSIQDRPRCAV